MIRRRRPGRTPPVAADGDVVIDGHIRARLLGLPILDLDAHVVVGTARSRSTGPAATGASAKRTTPRTPARSTVLPPVRHGARGDGDSNGATPSALGRAVRLLGEGSTALDDARRIRRRALTTPTAPRRSGATQTPRSRR